MINAEGVEIVGHLREALFPPREAVGGHARPVVSGEAPVLTFRRKWIGRCSGLHRHVEKLWGLPRIRAVAEHADGDVALHHETAGVSVRRGGLKLRVQMKLHEAVERDVAISLGQRSNFCGIKLGMFRPPTEVRRAELVAEHTERSVGREPVLVFGEEFFVFLAAERGGSLRWENLPKKTHFDFHHGLVVHGLEVVQFFTRCFEQLEVPFVFRIGGGG